MADWKVGAARDLPMNTSASWDGSAAEKSIFDASGFNGDSPDPAKARRGFLVYDADNVKEKGGYKLPFAMMSNGKLTAYASGLRAAAQRLPQTDGLSSDTKSRVQAVIDSYTSKLKEKSLGSEVETFLTEDEIDEGYQFPARIRSLASDEVKTLENRLGAIDSEIFAENPPYIWRAEISSNRRDTFSTRMTKSTLQNYAEEAKQFTPFQNSHNQRELPFGRSFDGQLVEGENGLLSVEATYYTIPNLNLNGVNTTDLIRGMRSGIVRDVSVGFYGGAVNCSVCNRSIYSIDCEHVPGIEYQLRDANGTFLRREFAEGLVDNSHLGETSAVYHGSTPRALITKVQSLAHSGRIQPSEVDQIEMKYRMHVPMKRSIGFPNGIPNSERSTEQENKKMEGNEQTTDQKTERALAIDAIRSVLTDLGINPDSDPIETIRSLSTTNQKLAPLAKVGEQYQKDLVDEAITEGTRAFGSEFNADTYRPVLERSTIEQVKLMRDDWKKVADKTLAGGRSTEDPPSETSEKPLSRRNRSAYQA